MRYNIVGGGIMGLSLAWFLKKRYPHCHITLYEKTNRLGGWLSTHKENGFLFERGPRTFRFGHCPHLLQLATDLNLKILHAPPQKRYLLHKGKLRSFFSPLFFPTFFESHSLLKAKRKNRSTNLPLAVFLLKLQNSFLIQ